MGKLFLIHLNRQTVEMELHYKIISDFHLLNPQYKIYVPCKSLNEGIRQTCLRTLCW